MCRGVRKGLQVCVHIHDTTCRVTPPHKRFANMAFMPQIVWLKIMHYFTFRFFNLWIIWKILPLLMNWENWWGKKGWDLWKIEVGLQKLRRKPKFFRPYLNYPKVKAFFSSSVFPIHQQRKNFCFVMDPFLAFFWRKPVKLSWDWSPFNMSLTYTANPAVVDSMFQQRYHKCQIDPT